MTWQVSDSVTPGHYCPGVLSFLEAQVLPELQQLQSPPQPPRFLFFRKKKAAVPAMMRRIRISKMFIFMISPGIDGRQG